VHRIIWGLNKCSHVVQLPEGSAAPYPSCLNVILALLYFFETPVQISDSFVGVTISQGEAVEFSIDSSEDARKKAVNVTGPGGVHVQGAPRRMFSALPQHLLFSSARDWAGPSQPHKTFF
jgi:hypothetical protein